MAEETVHSLALPKISVPVGGKSRINDSAVRKSLPNSTQNINPQCRTGNPNSANGKQNVLPHYLRASTGSCHDLCKYGTKHEFEGKGWHHPSTPKRLTASKPKKQNSVGKEWHHPITTKRITASKPTKAERKKTSMVKHKQFPVQPRSLDAPEDTKKEVLPPKTVEVSLQVKSLRNKKMIGNEKNMNFAAKRSVSVNAEPVLPKPVSLDTSLALSGRRDGDAKDGMSTGTLKAGTKKVPAGPTPLSSKSSASRVVSVYARKYRSLILASPPNDQNRTRKVQSRQSHKDRVPEKTLHVVASETESKNVEHVQNCSIIESPPLPKPNSRGLDNSEVQEKILHVVETEIDIQIVKSIQCVDVTLFPSSSSSLSPESSYGETSLQINGQEDGNLEDDNNQELDDLEQNNQEESEYTSSEGGDLISENELLVNTDKPECSGEATVLLRKHGTGNPEGKNHRPVKLEFKRGKVVDLKVESNMPKRLRFRRGRVLVGMQDREGNPGRRSLKERGVEEDNKSMNSSSRKVVLRHQGVQGKKDAQCSFNNVIEETASKLAESRKSKVKALVGAFETVISLQESKPSTQA